MITTNDIKLEERDPNKSRKLKMVTTNEVKPKVFEPKGKRKARSTNVITTGNLAEQQARRKKEVVIENRNFRIRQKKLKEKIKEAEEKRDTEHLGKEESIDRQIAVLQQKRLALKGA